MKKTTQASSFFTIMFFILFINFIQPMSRVFALSNEVGHYTEMEARISRLEERVQKLEQLLLDKTTGYSNKEKIVNPMQTIGKWQILSNWSRVKNGMTFDQVIRILGNPTKKDITNEDFGTWFYEGYIDEARSTVSGNVKFLDRKVYQVNPPVY